MGSGVRTLPSSQDMRTTQMEYPLPTPLGWEGGRVRPHLVVLGRQASFGRHVNHEAHLTLVGGHLGGLAVDVVHGELTQVGHGGHTRAGGGGGHGRAREDRCRGREESTIRYRLSLSACLRSSRCGETGSYRCAWFARGVRAGGIRASIGWWACLGGLGNAGLGRRDSEPPRLRGNAPRRWM